MRKRSYSMNAEHDNSMTRAADLEAIRAGLANVSDPLSLLEGIFAYAPVGLQIYKADGQCLMVNRAFRELFGSEPPPEYNVLRDEEAARRGILDLIHRAFAGETVDVPPTWYDPRKIEHVQVTEGRRVAIAATFFPLFDRSGAVSHVAIVFKDMTAELLAREEAEAERNHLREESRINATLRRVGVSLAGELNLERLVQKLTDEATALTRAQVGAFFYNVRNEEGESYQLYTISGVPRERFAQFPLPRNTPVFDPTYRGERVVRFDDVMTSSLYGRPAPYYGMPPGHLPVRSYLAVPVVSRSGVVLGGLFFGHENPGVFTERDEELIGSIAAQAAVAIDNALLYKATRTTEERLRQSQEYYRLVTETIPQMVWTAGPDGHLDYYNGRFREYTGLPAGQVEESGWHLVHPMDVKDSRAQWDEAVRTGTNYESEFRFRRASDGSYRWHLGRALPVRDDEGRVVKWFGTMTDIEEQKRTQQGLRFLAEAGSALGLSLDYHSTLADVARLAVREVADWCAVDLVEEDGSIRRLAVHHRDPVKMKVAQELWKKYPPRPDDPHGPAAVARTGRAELMSEIPDGAIDAAARDETHARAVRALGLRSYMCVPIEARDRVVGAISFATAESGRNYVAEDLAFAEEVARRARYAITNALLYRELQEAGRMKDEFLATVSHELRTPVTAILGWAHVLRAQQSENSPLNRGLEIIERNARAQTRLVEDILDTSRIITGKLRLEFRIVDLVNVVRDAVEMLRPTAEAKGVHLDMPADLPSCVVSGDAGRLQQVVWNLVSNAIKFTPRDGRVEVRLAYDGRYATLTVRDTGAGIGAEFLPHVFERFRQADSSSTRPHGGLGLGLAIARHLIELHGGAIQAASEGEGRGATFTVTLPVLAST
jgi:PAS domain S-box-containing protein